MPQSLCLPKCPIFLALNMFQCYQFPKCPNFFSLKHPVFVVSPNFPIVWFSQGEERDRSQLFAHLTFHLWRPRSGTVFQSYGRKINISLSLVLKALIVCLLQATKALLMIIPDNLYALFGVSMILFQTHGTILKKYFRGHTDLNHGPIGLQPIALPLSYIPKTAVCGHKTGNICWVTFDFGSNTISTASVV